MVIFNKFIIKILIILLYSPVSMPMKTIDHKINHNQSLYSQSYYQSKFSQIKFFSTMGLINSIYICYFLVLLGVLFIDFINEKTASLLATKTGFVYPIAYEVQLKEKIIFFILTIICPLICIVLKINHYNKFNKEYNIHWKYLASFLIMEIVFIILSFIGCFFTSVVNPLSLKIDATFGVFLLINIITILIYYGIINSLLLSYFNFKNISMDDINHLNINKNNNVN